MKSILRKIQNIFAKEFVLNYWKVCETCGRSFWVKFNSSMCLKCALAYPEAFAKVIQNEIKSWS